MRILIVSNLYPDARLPAFGTFVAAHAEALRRAGADVDLVAITGIAAHEGVPWKYLSLSLRSLAAAIRGRIGRQRPQIVEAHVAYPTAVPAWLAATILGARLVVYSHGSDVTRSAPGFHRRLARKVFRAASLHVANSSFIAGLLTSRFGVDPGRVTVLSPGIDFERFSSRLDEPRRGILFVGRLASGKGVFELLRAVARLEPGTPLRFVGDGPERGALELEAASLGVSASFDGALPPADVAAAMQRAAVLAMPSIHPEGLGLVALEAMAAGALVVATDVGGIPESVTDSETGWLVPPGDVPALASALADALAVSRDETSERRDTLLRTARDRALGQDVNAIARQTLTRYASLIGAGRNA